MKYIKQALAMMREEKLFSGIHIAGTALAIAFTMVMAVVYYIKLAPIYPEVNRMKTVYFDGIRVVNDGNGGGAAQVPFGQKALEEWFLASPNIEYCAPTILAGGSGKLRDNCREFVFVGDGYTGIGEYHEAIINRTNADFFKIYEYDFLGGRPFTKQEVEDEEDVCVISDAFAERIFGKDKDPMGQIVALESGWGLRVVGVVRNGSQLTPDSYADVFLPYTLWEEKYGSSPYAGEFAIVATVKDTEHLKALKKEFDEIAARLSLSYVEIMGGIRWFGEDAKTHVELTRNLETHPMHALRTAAGDDEFDLISDNQVLYHFAGLLFVLLFVPALNLCGIVAGRMERRTAEMGVRKTFGARRSTLLNQVVAENLVLTSIGGIIGLVLSWLAIYNFRTELLGMFFDNTTLSSAPLVTGEMLFSPLLFVGAFISIILLNLIAAVVPAWWSLRKPIVESMMEKR
jgi:putative ABC transport system permease protein